MIKFLWSTPSVRTFVTQLMSQGWTLTRTGVHSFWLDKGSRKVRLVQRPGDPYWNLYTENTGQGGQS